MNRDLSRRTAPAEGKAVRRIVLVGILAVLTCATAMAQAAHKEVDRLQNSATVDFLRVASDQFYQLDLRGRTSRVVTIGRSGAPISR